MTPFSRHRTLAIGSVDTHVAEVGEGPAIVFLHGNPDSHTVWRDVVAELAMTHRCIAPDLPGFGGSIVPADFDCSLENQADFVRGVLDALELDQVHLVVHDVGGAYGLAFACQNVHRLQSLTIFNTNFFSDYRWHFWARVWRTPILGELAMGITNRPLFVREMRQGSPRMPRDYALEAYEHFKAPTKRMVLRWYRAMDPAVYAVWEERLITVLAGLPRQVLWGDLDPFIPASFADRFGCDVTRFSDCGHWVMLEEPERSAQAIRELVAQKRP